MTSPIFKRVRNYSPAVPLEPAPAGSAIPDPSLQLWLRSENIPTATTRITSWPDASGKARNAFRLVRSNSAKILWDSTTIGNGQKAATWDGKGEARLALPPSFQLVQYGTFAIVYKINNSSAGYACSWWDRNNATNRSFAWSDSTLAGGFDPAIPAPVTATHTNPGRTTRVVMLTSTAAGWTARSAARTTTNVSLLTGFARPPGGRFVLGGRYSDNQNLTSADAYSGAIAEVLFYSSSLPLDRQEQIVRELCTKFAVPYV